MSKTHPQYPIRNLESPVEFTHISVLSQKLADNKDPKKINDLNTRSSHIDGGFKIDLISGRPLNPAGETGINGRGLLWRWGPNHAADPLVFRVVKKSNNEKVIQVLVIKRRDTGDLALPGGMVDPQDGNVSVTAKRELVEEAGNLKNEEEKAKFKSDVDEMFKIGKIVYKGQVDDPRNTNNAWMETVVIAVVCPFEIASRMRIRAGDDAVNALWLDTTSEQVEKLYALHSYFVKLGLQALKEEIEKIEALNLF